MHTINMRAISPAILLLCSYIVIMTICADTLGLFTTNAKIATHSDKLLLDQLLFDISAPYVMRDCSEKGRGKVKCNVDVDCETHCIPSKRVNVCDEATGICRQVSEDPLVKTTVVPKVSCDEKIGLVTIQSRVFNDFYANDNWICASYVDGVYSDGTGWQGFCDPGEMKASYGGLTRCSCKPLITKGCSGNDDAKQCTIATVLKVINGSYACVVNPQLYENGD